MRYPYRYRELSINPSGKWTAKQAEKVLQIINQEAYKLGLPALRTMDVTIYGDKCRWFILVPEDTGG
jgi:hypothetical protein